MRIGIFGGSFNPIHCGHVALGRELVDQGHIDQLWYMVSPQNPFKQSDSLMPEDLRLELVRVALADDPCLQACDFEFSLPRPSYTVHTLAALRSAYPQHEFVLVIGADNLLAFDRWYQPEEILRHHRVLVYRRPGCDISHPDPRFTIVDTSLYDISSTAIRAAMHRPDYNGEGLPPAVWTMLKNSKTHELKNSKTQKLKNSKTLKHILLTLFCLFSLVGRSQTLYPEIPTVAWDVMLDRFDQFDGCLISNKNGQYLGQMDSNHILGGFGFFIDNKDNQRIGLFRGGAFVYGITIAQKSAFVGTPDDFACYSLSTSQLDYTKCNGETLPPAEGSPRFVSATYENGDRYVGEYLNGKRHGLGIYYYANGDFWFGRYKDGERMGEGCLYGNDYVLFIGRWAGDKALRQTMVRCR